MTIVNQQTKKVLEDILLSKKTVSRVVSTIGVQRMDEISLKSMLQKLVSPFKKLFSRLKMNTKRIKEQWVDWLDVHFNRWEEIRNVTELKDKKKVLNEYIHEIMVKDYDDSTKEHHIEIHFRIPIINDKIHLEKNKDGSISRDKKGLGKYKVIERSLNNPLTHQKLFDGN